MKKFISLLCVVAMMCTFFMVPVNADANNYWSWETEDVAGETGAIYAKLYVTTTYTLNAHSVRYDFANLVAAGATIEKVDQAADTVVTKFNWAANKGLLACNFASTTSTVPAGKTWLGTLKISGLTEGFTVSAASNFTPAAGDVTDGVVSSNFTVKDFVWAPATATEAPTEAPTAAPTEAPTAAPTAAPTEAPTVAPTAAPTEAPTEAPVTGDTIYVQAEEFDTYTTKAGNVITAADVAGGMLAGGMAVGDCMYKSNGEAFPSENSGAGIPLNEWSMVYGVTWRGNAGQELATYTANVPAAGKYKVTLSAISWGNRDMNVTVGNTTKNVATTYATDTATLVPMEIGEFDFVAGDNTITFAVGTIGSYDIQVDYIAIEPVATEPVVGPTAEAAADLWYDNAGTAEIVKVWNCTAPAGTASVALTFNAEAAKTVDLTPIAGEATAAFQVLLFNTNGAAVTLDIE